MRNVLIIDYYKWWNKRQSFFYNWFASKGFSVEYFTADFDHITKSYSISEALPECGTLVHVPRYSKNLSFSRIVSNYCFYKKICNILNDKKPDVVVCLIPSNFLGMALKVFKRNNPKSKVVLDIIDLWPETLPFHRLKTLLSPILFFWKKLRMIGIDASDVVLLECELFRKTICEELSGKDQYVLYLQKSNGKPWIPKSLNANIIFSYLGSINNIIDIDKIVKVLAEVNKYKKVCLSIIGCGSSEKEFVNKATNAGLEVNFHGAVFDEAKKHEILSACHFGINIMKSDVVVGLTTKSMDYLEESLPLISNIAYDTHDLIGEYLAGYNIDDENLSDVCKKIAMMDDTAYNQMSMNAKKLFDEKFSTRVFEEKLDGILLNYL